EPDRHLHRCYPIDARAVAELARVVPSPSPERAVILQHDGVPPTGRDLAHVADSADRHRRQPPFVEPLGPRAVSELAIVIAAPRPYGAIGHERDRNPTARGDGLDIRQPDDAGRNPAVGIFARPELARIVVPP